MQGEQGTTRSQLIAGALGELLAVGQADFTMEGVARRSFFSIGTMYKYWPDRTAVIIDLADHSLCEDVTVSLAGFQDPEDVIDWAFGSGRSTWILMGEVILAGHNDESVARSARALWQAVLSGLSTCMSADMAWYVATAALGSALLDAIGLPGPQPAIGRTRWLADACANDRADIRRTVTSVEPDQISMPASPARTWEDATTVALIQAAQQLLSEGGVSEASTRTIAKTAGVTTGAVYRRYETKSQLFADVLLVELSPDRYSWTWELLQALATDDPYRDAARLMTKLLLVRNSDPASQRVLLQIGVAARNDPTLRAQVAARIEAVDRARCEMFARLIDVGLFRPDVDPGVFSWSFQNMPVGVRALLPLGLPVAEETATSALTSVLMAAAHP